MKSQHLALNHGVFRRAPTDTATTAKPVLPTIVKTPPKATDTATKATVTPAVSKTVTPAVSVTNKTSVSSTSTSSTSSSSSATSSSTLPLTTSSSTTLPIKTPLDRGAPSSTSSSSSLSITASHTSSALETNHTDTTNKSAGDNDKTTPSTGLGTGGIIGIIAAAVGGVILIILVVGFVLRRMRKKRKSSKFAADFDADKFRRSAVLLDEKDQGGAGGGLRPRPPTIIERKNKKPAAPPVSTMPPPPSMAYPYSDQVSVAASAPPSVYGVPNGSDHGHGLQQQPQQPQQYPQFGPGGSQYGALPPPVAPQPSQGSIYNGVPGAYGVPPPGAYGAQYDQAGYGAPPIPGTYGPGAYAPYAAGPVDPRYPYQYSQQRQQQHQQQQFQQGYPQQQQQQQQPQQLYQQHSGQYGQQMNMNMNANQGYPGGQGPAGGRMDSMIGNPNPYASARSGAPPSPVSNSPPSSVSSSSHGGAVAEKQQTLHLATALDHDDMSGAGPSGSTSLRRQPTQSSGAPPAYDASEEDAAKWAARRDQKVKPVELRPPVTAASTGAEAATSSSSTAPAASANVAARPNATSGAERPVSGAYSLYNQDDVYGGM
ncbi:hypothetical protein CPC08DRAFT_767799 [Agrocybe pediades]|nr:hypothetical protein CPC08DRAFT_767799 [Agrocybe pediades]